MKTVMVRVNGYFNPRQMMVDESNQRLLFQVSTHNHGHGRPCEICENHITHIERRMEELKIEDWKLDRRENTSWFDFPIPEADVTDPIGYLSKLLGVGVRLDQ